MSQPLPPSGDRNQLLGQRLLGDPRTHIALLLMVVPLGLLAVGHALGLDRDEVNEQHLIRYFVLGGTAVVYASVGAVALVLRRLVRGRH